MLRCTTRIPIVEPLLIYIVRDAWEAGELSLPGHVLPLAADLADDTLRLGTVLSLADAPPSVLVLTVTAWTQLIGAISLELFGHLKGSFEDQELFVNHSIEVLAHIVGLRPIHDHARCSTPS